MGSSGSFGSPMPDMSPAMGGMSGMGGGFGADGAAEGVSSYGGGTASSYERPAYVKPLKKGTGMQLGKPKEGASANLLQAMADEGEVLDDVPGVGAGGMGGVAGFARGGGWRRVRPRRRDGGGQLCERRGLGGRRRRVARARTPVARPEGRRARRR